MVKMDYFEMCLLKLSLKEINLQYAHIRASSVVQWVKNSPAMQETQEMQVRSLGWEGPLEKEMATCSNILVWEMPRTEDPAGLQSMRSQRVRHNLVTKQ